MHKNSLLAQKNISEDQVVGFFCASRGLMLQVGWAVTIYKTHLNKCRKVGKTME